MQNDDVSSATKQPVSEGESAAGVAWVIEHGDSPVSAPLYYSLTQGRFGYWEADHLLALRFARKQDAQEYEAIWLSDADHGIRICEHEWVEAAPAVKPDNDTGTNVADEK